MYVPSEVFLVSGVGRHAVPVASFERALRDAGVEPYNIVPVSSILPPDADFVEPHEGVERLSPGQVVHAVLGRDTTDEGRATAAVGVARADEGHGYFVERSGVSDAGGACNGAERDSAETLAREMVETSDATGEVVDSFAVEAKASVEEDDRYVTAVVAAVFVPPEGITGASP
ncbi:MAG: pyruvoyl-dependent arginine decarboxylase [Halobacteriales archaeon]|nr:pyruvoyl-dependent arginine decarboxylase [Halobacteriales archaeon]